MPYGWHGVEILGGLVGISALVLSAGLMIAYFGVTRIKRIIQRTRRRSAA